MICSLAGWPIQVKAPQCWVSTNLEQFRTRHAEYREGKMAKVDLLSVRAVRAGRHRNGHVVIKLNVDRL